MSLTRIDKAGVGPQQKSIIDRCTALVYQEAEKTGKPATLCHEYEGGHWAFVGCHS